MTNVGQRFGVIDYDDKGQIAAFREKSDKDGSMINIGYMVMEPGVFDYWRENHLSVSQQMAR